MKASISDLISTLNSRPAGDWPRRNRHAVAMRHGTMYAELYAPVGSDEQIPHQQDELYIVRTGSGYIEIGEETHEFEPGDVFFVPAEVPHRFTEFSDDFSTWVILWGPEGGE